ncbi:multidrug ABC transporter ATP-binding protein [Arachidicoccus ginsenosidimutans]|uniref:ABC transporter ATP-binding protein n=1 Tax=Arachidicoccus sp. BS20 TaxID=1850526 RepID=UPI0007F0D8F7|nr:ABC transporter ATP-binding protein [Arachidicoccus sp. BS20]ANI89610.1 multidrug ABC transporter ATP-binding protein [Arachidicoccus sp. BS20]
MEEPIVRISHLSHKYNGSNWAIRDINIEIYKTGIVGLLGSNGAGKSTTMNILCGVINQTEGKVVIGGIDMREHPEEAKKQIGFLPQNPPLYTDLTVDEYLEFAANMRDIPQSNIKSAMDEAKERCGIAHFSKRLIRNLSGGYRQRVGIAQAIIHKPKLVVLDEPTNGLDPNQIIEVRALIKEIAEERSVIFSTHILSEVQVLCKDIKMIDSGKIVFSDTMDAFNNYVTPHSMILILANPPAENAVLQIPGVTKAEFLTAQRLRIYFDGSQDVSQKIIETAVLNKWLVQEAFLEKSSLDEVFAELSGKGKNK